MRLYRLLIMSTIIASTLAFLPTSIHSPVFGGSVRSGAKCSQSSANGRSLLGHNNKSSVNYRSSCHLLARSAVIIISSPPSSLSIMFASSPEGYDATSRSGNDTPPSRKSRKESSDDGVTLDPNETIARTIIVTGDVDGGYYRSCVKNEAQRFRRLLGTMSPPNGSKRAEIYVEGKKKMVEGFVRWCQRGDIGLSQSIRVEEVLDQFPTGLYDDFYIMKAGGAEKEKK